MLLIHEFATAGKRKPLRFNIGKVVPNDGKKIILADAEHSPFLINELGRIREMSFRAIGGGTGTARDNDLFDNYYKHLILWDDNDLEIVGAYRIGECKDIIKEKGKEGLCSSNLCHFSENFKDYCSSSVELGRSFVQPQYWGSRAFDSLWQAVTVYLAHNPQIRYTYGVVTINGNTPKKAISALVYFYTHHFACHTKMMKAKQPYIIPEHDLREFDELFKDLSYKDGFVVLKKYLKDLGTIVPTLFKQYIELYEEGAVRYFDFNTNTAWGGVVEGFIMSDNHRMKKSIQERHLKNFNQTKTIDPLTKLYCRSHFIDLAHSITKHQRQTDRNFSLVVFEIENRYDEEITNKILQTLAKIFQNSLRDDDIISRWDEQTFIIMLKNVTTEQTKQIMEKLKATIEDAKINNTYKISCSSKQIDLSQMDNPPEITIPHTQEEALIKV